MSMAVDQRIVEMRFDNKQFEQNVSTTMSSIDKLKQSLNFKGAADSLDGLNSAANKVDFRQLENTACQAGFSIRDVWLKVATVFEYQIARRITHAASNIAKALTIDPIFTGFSEYETQINAIQTILANTESKGTTLDDVNGALDELNAYADKTIYNFTEMTRNIGTFTAAGVDLDTSVSAIKGIANLAAVSGSTSQQASTAMYQLSQALASGTVKLMDWNSVVNAGMGGQVFQDALKETARVHGIAIDDIIKQEGSFRESLSQGWLSSEILTETLAKFTGDLNAEQLKSMGYTEDQIEGILKMGQTANDAATKVKTFSQLFDTLKEAAQSGWSQTWEIVVGDFEEARNLLTTISDTLGGLIGKSAEARNDLLENWKALGGRSDLIDAFKYAFEGVMSIVQAVSEAMKEVFPPLTAEKLVAFCKGLKELAQRFAEVFKVNGKTTTTFNNLKRTLKGVFAIVDIVRQVFVALIKVVGKVLGVTGKVGEGLLYFTAIIGDWLVAISDALEYSGILEFAIGGIGKILEFVIGKLSNFGRAISESFIFKAASEGLNAFLGLINSTKDNTEVLAQAAENVKAAWIGSGLYKFLMGVWNVIKSIGAGVKKIFGGLFSSISDAFGHGDWDKIFGLINGLLSGGLIVGLITLVKKVKDLFNFGGLIGSFQDIVDKFGDVLDNLGNAFKSFQNKMNAEALKAIAVAIAILVGSLVVLTFLDENKLYTAIAALAVVMGLLTAMMAVMKKGSDLGKADFDTTKLSGNILVLSAALLIAAGAFSILGSMEWGEIGRGLTAMLGIFAILTSVVIILGKWAKLDGDMKKGTKAMMSMAFTLLLICAPLAIIGSMEWETIGKGLAGIAGVLVALAGVQILYSRLADNSGKMLAGAAAMTIMALAINMIVPPLILLGHMPWEVLGKAGASLVVLLGALGGVQILYGKLANGAGRMLAGAAAIAIMAYSINLLIPILTLFAILPLPALVKAIGGLTVLLAALGGIQVMYGKLANGAGNMLAGAGAIAIMALSLNLLIPMLLTLGLMDIPTLLKSVLGFTAILAALGGAMIMMGKLGGGAGNMLATAGAITIMAVAIGLLVPSLLLLGSMSVGQAITSIAMLAAALGVLVAAGYLLRPIIGTLSLFGKVVIQIGVAILAAGAGLVLFGLGLTAIAIGITHLVGAAAALVGGLGSVCVALVALIASVVEGVIRGIGAGIIALCEIIIESLPLLADVCIELVGMLCDVIIGCAPKIIDTILILVLKLCESFAEFIPPIVAALVRLIAGVISALAQELPGLIKSLVDLLFSFVEGVINALGGMNPEGLAQALKNVGMLTIIIAALAAISYLTPAAMTGVIGMGLVVAELSLVLAALGALGSIPGLQDMIGEGGNLLQAVGTAIGQFVGGLVGGFAKGATADLPEIASNLSGFAENIGGFLDIAPTLADSIKSLAGASIATAIADFFNFGGGAMDVFAKELPVLGLALAAFSAATASVNADQVKGVASAAEAIADMTHHIPNSGGVVSWITGDNSIAKFGSELVLLGLGIKAFAVATTGVSPDQIKGAASAAKSIAEMTNSIPNSGGVVSWITGENSIAKFSAELGLLGLGIKAFAVATAGVVPEQVTAAAAAAKHIADMTANIPNSGGVISWLTGENSIANFSAELGVLGQGIKSFATATSGIEPEQVKAAADAAISIAKITDYIPKEDGIAQWFAGEASISKFADDMGSLGTGLKSFATNTQDIDPATVKSAAEAAIVLAGITEHVPTEGGISAWFAGEQSLSKFATDMGSLGTGLSSFAANTKDISPDTVKAAAEAAIILAGITDHVPTEGGVVAWFTGEQSLSKFATDMGALGTGLNSFATNTAEVDPAKVEAAANAAKSIAEMTQHIPNSDGVKQWFTGEASIAKFANQLPALGEGIAGFATGLGDAEIGNVEPAARAAKAIAEMTQYVPKEGGIKAWFSGETSISKFAGQLPKLGEGLLGFSKSIEGMNPENVEVAATAAKKFGEMTETVPTNSNKIVTFGTNLGKFGTKMQDFIKNTKGVSESSVKGANALVKLAKDAADINSDAIKNVASALKDLTKAAKDMEKDIKSSMKDAGKKAVEGYVKGIKDNLKDAKDAAADMVEKAADKAADKADAFKTAGKDCVKGFANGIKNNKYLATDAGSEVGKAALEAAKEAVKSNSPSKKFMELGHDSDAGFAIGLTRYAGMVYDSAYDVGERGLTGIGDSISKISRLVENGMDTQPTIRPVLDLSDVQNGVGRIGGLFANTPLGVRANLGAITSMMSSRNQNGSNKDVTDELKKLRDDISKIKTNVYNIDGVTYDDGSNVSEAVRTLIHAAMIERRV